MKPWPRISLLIKTQQIKSAHVAGLFRHYISEQFNKLRVRTDSPITDDDDDNHRDEEHQPSSCWANDERQLLLNAGVVFRCRKKKDIYINTDKHVSCKNTHTHARRVTSWNIWASVWATAYGGSNGWQTNIRLGEPMTILASWLVACTIFQSTVNVFRCHRYGQIIWQKVCEVRESMFGWDPDWSGSQKWETSYWMCTQPRRQILFLSTTNDKQLCNLPDKWVCEFPTAF